MHFTFFRFFFRLNESVSRRQILLGHGRQTADVQRFGVEPARFVTPGGEEIHGIGNGIDARDTGKIIGLCYLLLVREINSTEQ